MDTTGALNTFPDRRRRGLVVVADVSVAKISVVAAPGDHLNGIVARSRTGIRYSKKVSAFSARNSLVSTLIQGLFCAGPERSTWETEGQICSCMPHK